MPNIHGIFQGDEINRTDHGPFCPPGFPAYIVKSLPILTSWMRVVPGTCVKLRRCSRPQPRENCNDVRPIAVTHGVGVCRTRIETLAHHQHGFAMDCGARADPLHVGRERHVAGRLFPHEVERSTLAQTLAPPPVMA